jgi:hypothetical protein
MNQTEVGRFCIILLKYDDKNNVKPKIVFYIVE